MKRVAVLIDGSFCIRRLRSILEDKHDASALANKILLLVETHLVRLDLIKQGANLNHGGAYQIFFYDARPYTPPQGSNDIKPVTNSKIDFAKTPAVKFRSRLFATLEKQDNLVLRFGEVRIDESKWHIKPNSMQKLLYGKFKPSDLTDADFLPAFQQKHVDMLLGTELISMVINKEADVFVLVANDSDFYPATKLARSLGGHVILDPLGRKDISKWLRNNVDEIYDTYSYLSAESASDRATPHQSPQP